MAATPNDLENLTAKYEQAFKDQLAAAEAAFADATKRYEAMMADAVDKLNAAVTSTASKPQTTEAAAPRPAINPLFVKSKTASGEDCMVLNMDAVAVINTVMEATVDVLNELAKGRRK